MRRVSSRGLLFVGAMIIAAAPVLESAGRLDPVRFGPVMLFWLLPLVGVFDAGRESLFLQVTTLLAVALISVVYGLLPMLSGSDVLFGGAYGSGTSTFLFLIPIALALALTLKILHQRDPEIGAHWGRLWIGLHLFVGAVQFGLQRGSPMAWAAAFGAALVTAGEWLTRREDPPTGEAQTP